MKSTQQPIEITDVRILEGMEIERAGLAKELIMLGDEAKLETDADVSAMVDHYRRIVAVEKELEAERKDRQGAIKAAISRINDQYTELKTGLTAVKAKLRKMLSDYQAEQERKASEAAEVIRKAEEEKALAEAKRLEDERRKADEKARAEQERLEAEGKAVEAKALAEKAAEDSKRMQAEADAAVQDAIDAPKHAPAPVETMRGNYGGVASARGTWKWELEDIAKVPREHFILNEKRIGALVRSGERNIPGIRIYQESKVVVR